MYPDDALTDVKPIRRGLSKHSHEGSTKFRRRDSASQPAGEKDGGGEGGEGEEGGGGWRGPGPNSLCLCDLGLIPDVASSLPAQDTDTPCQHTNTAKDTLVIPRRGVIALWYVSHAGVALTQCPSARCQSHTAGRLIPWRAWRSDHPHFTEGEAEARRADVTHPPMLRASVRLETKRWECLLAPRTVSSTVAGGPVLVHHNPRTLSKASPQAGAVGSPGCPGVRVRVLRGLAVSAGDTVPTPSPQETRCSRDKPE